MGASHPLSQHKQANRTHGEGGQREGAGDESRIALPERARVRGRLESLVFTLWSQPTARSTLDPEGARRKASEVVAGSVRTRASVIDGIGGRMSTLQQEGVRATQRRDFDSAQRLVVAVVDFDPDVPMMRSD
jgi:hypothetical protein